MIDKQKRYHYNISLFNLGGKNMKNLTNRERKINKGINDMLIGISAQFNAMKKREGFENISFADRVDLFYIGNNWVGNYGWFGFIKSETSEFTLDSWISDSESEKKRAINIISKNRNKLFFEFDGDVVVNIFIMDGDAKVIDHKGSFFIFIEGTNQIYDISNQYWFNMKDSNELRRCLARGYKYCDPQDWFEDCQVDREYRWIQSKLDKGHVPLIYNYDSEKWTEGKIKSPNELYNTVWNHNDVELDGFIFTRDQYEVYKYRKEED